MLSISSYGAPVPPPARPPRRPQERATLQRPGNRGRFAHKLQRARAETAAEGFLQVHEQRQVK